jgi:hypothetical protein
MIRDLTIWDPTIFDKISDIKKNHHGITKIILNAALEYQYDIISSKDNMEDLISFTKDYSIELHIITSGHPDFKLIDTLKYNHVHVHHWPTFWLTLTFSRLLEPKNYQFNTSIGLDINAIEPTINLFKYSFITMNKRPKVHRATMMDMLAKYNMIDKGIVIWRELSQSYQYRYWKEQVLLVDQQDGFKNQEILPMEYAISFAQIVTESDEMNFIMSEKTGMPLYFNKPFLVLGCKHFHKRLKSFGFQLYDELFNYSFDEVDNVYDRCDLIAKNIKRYIDKTPEQLLQLYLTILPKCIHNKKTALRLATNSDLIPIIWEELIDHQTHNNIDDYPRDINNFIKTKEHEFRF